MKKGRKPIPRRSDNLAAKKESETFDAIGFIREEQRRGPIIKFISESNRIEGINRPVTNAEFDEFERFLALPKVTIADLIMFVKVYQPDAMLRDRPGLNVHIGTHVPMLGGVKVAYRLQEILDQAKRGQMIVDKSNPDNAYLTHIAYEHLHPFTDGNGRSGRMLWAWQMQKFPLGFLHHFYYQTLAHNHDEV